MPSNHRPLLTILLAALIAALLLAPTPAPAADIYVSANTGSDDTGDGSQLAPYQTIGKAIWMSGSNDQILVAQGEYDEGLWYVCTSLTILGGYEPIGWTRNPAVFRSVITGELTTSNANRFSSTDSSSRIPRESPSVAPFPR